MKTFGGLSWNLGGSVLGSAVRNNSKTKSNGFRQHEILFVPSETLNIRAVSIPASDSVPQEKEKSMEKKHGVHDKLLRNA